MSVLSHRSFAILHSNAPSVAEPLELAGRGTEETMSEKPISLPSHRHATPSAPWPWIDIDDPVDKNQLEKDQELVPTASDDEDSWRGYPQSLYPNWTPAQVVKSGIKKILDTTKQDCVIYQVDVTDQGRFKLPPVKEILTDSKNPEGARKSIYDLQIPSDNRVRILFLEKLSGPVLQMLGTKYNIEPFFFSSSFKWIPSRYQESFEPTKGDHITICLTFLHAITSNEQVGEKIFPQGSQSRFSTMVSTTNLKIPDEESDTFHVINGPPTRNIDTQGPLQLKSQKRLLVPDLLSVHLIRNKEKSIIISYHPDEKGNTSAKYLHERIRFAGQSVYWQKIFQQYEDPTFVLLAFIWHTLYAWDEAFEHLYAHICDMEGKSILTRELEQTEELHSIRAHLYHYSSLLNDVRKSVNFLKTTRTPIKYEKDGSEVLDRECENLLAEIDRLETGRQMQDQRLKNVMNLVFSTVNITDSKSMHELTKLTARDSAGMKQIAYLTMFFLPASFIAAIFGMNVEEITPGTKGSLVHYVMAALPFTLTTIWIIIAFQSEYIFEGSSFWTRLGWPYLLIARVFKTRGERRWAETRGVARQYNIV